VDSDGLSRWFGEYLDTFAACARGDREIAALLRYYGVPMVITSDDGVTVLTTDDDVITVMQGQLDALRAAGYHHTDVLQADITIFNAVSGLIRGAFSRRDHQGAEIGRPTVTYVVTDGPAEPKVTVLAAGTV
jgi:hypothetical protein